MTHALYLARRSLADGGEPMLLPQGGWQGDWGNAMPVETAFAESYGAPSLGGPYGNPTPGPIAVEASPLGAFNSGSGDTSGAATPGSGRGPSSYSGPAQSLTGMDNLPSEILNGSTDYNGISQPGYNSSLGSISSTPLGPPDLGSNAPVTSGPFGWAGHSAPYGSGPAGMATLGPVSSGVQSTPAYDQMGNPMGFSTSNNFMDGRGYGQAPQAIREAGILGSPFGSKISDYNYGTPFSLNESFSQPNKGYSYGDKPVNPGFGGMSNAADSWSGGFDYSHLDGMDFDGLPGSVFGAELGSSSSPRGSSYNGAFAGQPFDMQGDYGTGGKNSTRAGNVGQYGAPVTTGMTPGFAAPSKGVAYGDESFADFGKGITVAPAIPTGFYDPMTGFSANLSGWGGGGGGGDYAGGGFGGGAPGLGGGVMGGDPAMGGGDRGMNRGGRVGREDGGRIGPFGEADDVALQRAAKFAGMVQTAPVEHPRHALEARLAPDEAARMDLSGYMMPNRAASVVNTEAGAELRDPDGNKVDWIKRPAVLPFTMDNGDFRWAMPAVAELAGNVMGGVAAPVHGAGMVTGAGPVRRVAESAALREAHPMMGIHNTRERGIEMADKLGGLPVPSMAIVNPEHGFRSYGDISLVAPPWLVEPGKGNPVFASDVYSPRFPHLSDEGDKIFKGYTNMGNRRYAPLTLDNVVKEMKGNIRGGEGGSYGAGSVRAAVTPQIKNMKQMDKERVRLVDKETFEPLKEEANNKLFEFADKYSPLSKYGTGFGYSNDVANVLAEVPKRGVGAFKDIFTEVTPEMREDAYSYLNYLRDMPTQYFEAKPQRGVALEEFAGAVVPHDLPLPILDVLRRRGVGLIEEYDPQNAASQIEAFRKFSNRRFADGGAVEPAQPTERRQEEARPYEPTIRDRLASWMMGDAERASPARRSMVEGLTGSTGLGTTGMGLVDVTPAGIPMAVQEARRDAQGGNWLGATMNATAVLPGAKVVTEPVKDALQGASRYIRAYHGSPHSFDRFSLSKIGTGEGAQAYGHGLYFAENEGVARGYRDALAKTPPEAVDAMQKLDNLGFSSPGQALAQARAHPDWMKRWDVDPLRESDAVPARVLQDYFSRPKGHMYEVAIKADPEKFLDWDKPLREQGAYDKIRSYADEVRQLGLEKEYKDFLDAAQMRGMSGSDFAAVATNAKRSNDPALTNDLRAAGIPGIKYLDAGSRTAGDGSRNYVVFDDNLIDILRKYGIGAGAVGAGGAMAVQNPQGDQ
jgi:hypothetical protein